VRRLFWQSRIPATLLCLCLLWHSFPSFVSAAELSETSANARRTSLKVGSFNIQVFGESKVKKTFVRDTILSIISRYDIIFIQEIRDDKNKAIYDLLDQLNLESGRNFKAIVSARLGTGEMKEQYAYFYDSNVVKVEDSYVFPDVNDDFSREPFVARFKGQGRVFTLAGIHIAPLKVREELRALGSVKTHIDQRFGDNNTFIMGDFNADCIYYKPIEGFDFFDESPRLMISNEEDTTVSPSSCAYDRVLGFGPIQSHTTEAQPFNFMQNFAYDLANAKFVSDHFPVEFSIEGTGEMDEIIPIPNKPVLIDEEIPTAEIQNIQMPVNIPEEAAADNACGIEPYKTPAGYCYGSFDGKNKRVSSHCCF
jgi:deoxyribonuclease-1-like protein